MSRVNAAQVSQDVFFERDLAGRIRLAQSDHAGAHFFKSLAELNRNKFVGQEGAGDRVALSMVHTIWNKGQGKIHIRDDATNEWVEVSKIGEAQNLVFRALETLFGVEAHNAFPEMVSGIRLNLGRQLTAPNHHEHTLGTAITERFEQGAGATLSESQGAAAGSTLAEQDATESKERRHSATTLEAASSLLMVQEFAAGLDKQESDEPTAAQQPEEQQTEEKEEKSDLQVKFENTKIDMIASFDSNSSSSSPPSSPESGHAKAAAAKPKKPERRRRSACASTDYVAGQPGIQFASVDANDVLCGGSGEGVLAIRHEGNKRFLKVIEEQMQDFNTSDDKGKLRMAQQTVENAVPRGRFLAYNPETGLWHELKRDKAWFKSLRTFLKRQARYEHPAGKSETKQRSPRPLPLHKPN